MKKRLSHIFLAPVLGLCLLCCGCSAIGEKSASLCIVYAAAAIVAFLLLVGYCRLSSKKNTWFLTLFSSVFVVDLGYLALSLSGTLEEALLANRLSYLGSVFLPLAMLMIILDFCRLRPPRWVPGVLLGVGFCVFLLAASPGYLDIYYKSVSFVIVNGTAMLKKVYGPWHSAYLFYLLAYFLATAGVILYAALRRFIESASHIMILAFATFINMGVWLLEQLVYLDFELLSVSYIICEAFLLALCALPRETCAAPVPPGTSAAQTDHVSPCEPRRQTDQEAPSPETEKPVSPRIPENLAAHFQAQLPRLTPAERGIYDLYLQGLPTREILARLNITENTLKYHNRNLYGKLGVSSRKELLEIGTTLAALQNTGPDA